MATRDEWAPTGWGDTHRTRARLARSVTSPLIVAGAALLVAVLVAVIAVMRVPRDPLAAEATGEDTPVPGVEDLGAVPDGVFHADAGDAVIVHVAGAVEKPGLVEVSPDARVADALEAAGGPTDEAQLDLINLARIVVDGEQILVPDEHGVAEDAGHPAHPGRVNVNTATQSELETLPRVGPAIASRIIEWRERNGPFRTPDDLLNVSGIGPNVFAQLEDVITIG